MCKFNRKKISKQVCCGLAGYRWLVIVENNSKNVLVVASEMDGDSFSDE